MARRRSAWTSARRGLYRTQRAMGDVDAARRGRLAHRVIRRRVTRAIFRGLGL